MEKLFSLQKSLASVLVDALRPELGESGGRSRTPTDDPLAYELYLKGKGLLDTRNPQVMPAAIRHLEEAAARDAGFALARAEIAVCHLIIGMSGLRPMKEAYPEARRRALEALEIDRDLPEAHLALGVVCMHYEWKWDDAEAHFRRALELNENSSMGHGIYAAFLMRQRRFEEATRHSKTAIRLEAYSLTPSATDGYILYVQRKYEEAAESLRKILELDPGSVSSLEHLALACVKMGKHAEAIAAATRAIELTGGMSGEINLLGYAQAASGDRRSAEDAIEKLTSAAERAYVSPTHRAVIHVGLGEKDRAFELLGRAAEERCWLLTILTIDPMFDSLRDDPRYSDLAGRLGLAP